MRAIAIGLPMCLIVFAWRMRPDFPLVVAANRDEWRHRPTARLHVWSREPAPDDQTHTGEIRRDTRSLNRADGIVAGRDLKDGGTWMGVNPAGRFAALTNVRDPARTRPDAPSRGALVHGFLAGDHPPAEAARQLKDTAARFNGFNLLAGDGSSLWWMSNHAPAPRALGPGVYGLSNSLLDTPWPKVVRAREHLARAIAAPVLDPSDLWSLLADDAQAPDEALPDTGVGLDWERRLSAAFIHGADYGTRSSTLVLQDAAGDFSICERLAGCGAT